MDSPGQLDILGHDGDPPGMDGAEVGILKLAVQRIGTAFPVLLRLRSP